MPPKFTVINIITEAFQGSLGAQRVGHLSGPGRQGRHQRGEDAQVDTAGSACRSDSEEVGREGWFKLGEYQGMFEEQ